MPVENLVLRDPVWQCMWSAGMLGFAFAFAFAHPNLRELKRRGTGEWGCIFFR
jgi:hypothetical protein